MDFELTEEQVELQRVARDVLDRECPPALVRVVVEARDDGEGLWKTFVELDWPGLAVAERAGGSGLGPVELAIILEGIHARFLMGKTVGEGFDHIGSLVEVMVQSALDQCSQSSIGALRG